MNQQAEDLLMGAPSEVMPKQLRELHIRLDLPKILISGAATAAPDFPASRLSRWP